LPPEVEGGIYIYEGFGLFIDNLLGDARMRRRAKEYIDSIFPVDESVDDPPPTELPLAVPGGTMTLP